MADDEDAPPMLTRVASFIPQGTDKERALKKNESMRAAKKAPKEEVEDAPVLDQEQPEGHLEQPNSSQERHAGPLATPKIG